MSSTDLGTGAAFGRLSQVDAGDLNVGYVQAGPPVGTAVVLLCRVSRDRSATPTARRTQSRRHTRRSSPGKYEHRTVGGGVGHDLPQEAPEEFARAVIDVDHF
jgi:hypothetical protein